MRTIVNRPPVEPPAVTSKPVISPLLAHRILSLVALLSLFQGLPADLRDEAVSRVYLSAGFGVLYGALLAFAVLISLARRPVTLRRLDLAVLGAALVRLVLQFGATSGRGTLPYGDDEGALVSMAARAFAAGGHVYGAHFPTASAVYHVSLTPLMDGRPVDVFGYPPLSVLLNAPFVPHGLLPAPFWVPVAGLWSLAALVAAGVLMFRLLPVPLRPAATLLLFGMSWMFPYARDGYPVFLTLPFLVVVLAGWSRIGAGGRLGRSGAVSACCLGVADSAHQLAWFLTAFVLLGVLLLRRGELRSWRPALAVTGRYAGLAGAVFLLVNLPFLIRDGLGLDGKGWAPGIVAVLTQHATPQGLGPVDISYYLTRGSGALGLYSTAAAALLLATLVLLALFPARLAPAIAVLPWPAFFLSTRSTETYFMLLTPLWLTALACNERASFATAWTWRPATRPAVLRSRPVRFGVPALLVLPAVVLLAVAVLTPPPLQVAATAATAHTAKSAKPSAGISRITATLRNTGDQPLTPAFATSSNAWMDLNWRIVSGPATLPAHATARYTLARIGAPFARNPSGPTYLRVLSDGPMTLTNERLLLG
ncbi:hypothetical protein [Streptacidiphilus fuscans]|uniref:Uncharacterized protein n=1 Tax=Streptacidiphilus fuscans TaxID=2789292 RepID=A0A931FE25_9ACTN|nr:hypothetical protein [Streptacidiphilus fuscans]MBF9070203.1 hypothetical protein [Streptacidiphilus fuscans]